MQRAHVHQDVQLQLLYTVAQYRNYLLLEPVGELQLLIAGVIQLVMYVVLGVLLQGEEGCCCHLSYFTCLDSKHSINIH